jgi:wobble nucleotide-excising tRNase
MKKIEQLKREYQELTSTILFMEECFRQREEDIDVDAYYASYDRQLDFRENIRVELTNAGITAQEIEQLERDSK